MFRVKVRRLDIYQFALAEPRTSGDIPYTVNTFVEWIHQSVGHRYPISLPYTLSPPVKHPAVGCAVSICGFLTYPPARPDSSFHVMSVTGLGFLRTVFPVPYSTARIHPSLSGGYGSARSHVIIGYTKLKLLMWEVKLAYR